MGGKWGLLLLCIAAGGVAHVGGRSRGGVGLGVDCRAIGGLKGAEGGWLCGGWDVGGVGPQVGQVGDSFGSRTEKERNGERRLKCADERQLGVSVIFEAAEGGAGIRKCGTDVLEQGLEHRVCEGNMLRSWKGIGGDNARMMVRRALLRHVNLRGCSLVGLRGGGAEYGDAEAEGEADAGASSAATGHISTQPYVSAGSGAAPMDTDSDTRTHISTTEDTGGVMSLAEAPVGAGGTKVIKYRHPTRNPKRDGIRQKIAECLSKYEQAGDVYTGVTAATAIEHSMYRYFGKDEMCARYNAKCRAILYNLRDLNNPDLRRRVLDGSVQPERLTLMDSVEMASDKMKKEREVYATVALQAITLGAADEQYASTDMFFCRKCQKRKCTYYQMQTRSADEPMTTFVTCLTCGNRWKA